MKGFRTGNTSSRSPHTVVDPYNDEQTQGRWEGSRFIPRVGIVGEHEEGFAPPATNDRGRGLIPTVDWNSAFHPEKVPIGPGLERVDPFREAFPNAPKTSARPQVNQNNPVDPLAGMEKNETGQVKTPFGLVGAPTAVAAPKVPFHQDQAAQDSYVKRLPAIGQQGTPANITFNLGYQNHGDPEKAFQEASIAHRATLPTQQSQPVSAFD